MMMTAAKAPMMKAVASRIGRGETTSGGVSELRLALVGNIFPSCSHQFLGALVLGSSKLCRKFPTVLGKLSILGNCFHRVTSRDNVRRGGAASARRIG